AFSVLLLAAPGLAVAGFDDRLELEIEERGEARIDGEHHVAAVTAVTAVGSAVRAELLAQGADTPLPTVAGTDVHLHFLDEFHHALGRRVAAALPKEKQSLVPGCGSLVSGPWSLVLGY